MKVGDKFPVVVAGVDTGQWATVKELADGTVTIEFPGTRFVAAVKTEITAEKPTQEGSTEHIITGADRVQSNPADTTAQGGQVTSETGLPDINIDKPETKQEVVETPVVQTGGDANG